MTDRAFPRVNVSSVQVKRVKDTGERGIAQFFPELEGGKGPVERAGELVRGERGEHKLVYNLNVAAASERGARTTARAFVRAKNIFEPSVVNVENSGKVSGEGIMKDWAEAISGTRPDSMPSVADTYSVTVSVTK